MNKTLINLTMNYCTTLRVRKLPAQLSAAEKIDLLKHFGAIQVKCVGTKNVTAFATFSSVDAARSCLRRLHQLEVLGKVLSVDFAPSQDVDKTSSLNTKDDIASEAEGQYEKFLRRVNSWTSGLDLTQPPPPHLRYHYPPPSMAVLSNISRALAAVPKFYTQVLHLMNKMNLPSPFTAESSESHQAALSALVCASDARLHQFDLDTRETAPGLAGEEADMQTSTSESELESDGGENQPSQLPSLPLKRVSKSKRRVAKRPKLMRSVTVKSQQAAVPVQDVFELSSDIGKQKKIELRLGVSSGGQQVTLPVVSDAIEPVSGPSEPGETTEGFGVLFPPVPEPVDAKDQAKAAIDDTDGATITMNQLRANRLTEKDRSVLSVFRGYQSGAPSCRLYIKNLSKTVTARELHFIFRAFLKKQESNDLFDIRLMTEGRMRGQAFVTFPSVAEASSALKESNGYLLKDRPLVVQFARSATAKAKPMLE